MLTKKKLRPADLPAGEQRSEGSGFRRYPSKERLQRVSNELDIAILASAGMARIALCNVNGFALASLSIHGRQKAFKKAFKNTKMSPDPAISERGF